MNEMLNGGQPATYIASNNTYDQLIIIRKHLNDMKLWNITVPSVMEKLPSLYWMPKVHKNLYSSRFIVASNQCSTKPLSRLLTMCLTTVLLHYKEYCAGIYRNTGINCYWIINNALSVLHSVQALTE